MYAPNPMGWVDPFGLAKRGPVPSGQGPHNEVIAQWGREATEAGGTVQSGGGVKRETLISTPGGQNRVVGQILLLN